MRPNYSRSRDAHNTERIKIEAFTGLLYMAGVLRAAHLILFEFWSNDGKGVLNFRNCMNVRSFKFLITALRFDDSNTWQERRIVDKLASTRSFVQKLSDNFTVNVMIDEMLQFFRGKCAL
ncbi:hypothetical protein ANN_11162 [Periplaneta americana]|uniref:PiggyBac transposable element-derived protein domain-containing protein n=1 Tax=Periplaneta americana TaxID=6978 RepID=A0ABQ8T4Z5_PERAM|nr:hypothetical protein ANN_11162 [Periplaneta americana]